MNKIEVSTADSRIAPIGVNPDGSLVILTRCTPDADAVTVADSLPPWERLSHLAKHASSARIEACPVAHGDA